MRGPPANEIPCGQPGHWNVALLAGGPPTGKRQSDFPLATSNFIVKNFAGPLRAFGGFAILAASADGPGSRKERDSLVLLGG